MFVREMPVSERPAYRVKNYGVNTLNNAELLSIIIKDKRNISAMETAQKVISGSGDIAGLSDICLSELKKINGIGDSNAVEILAAIELGKRIYRYNKIMNIAKVDCPDDAYEYAYAVLGRKSKENFAVILMDTKNHVLSMPIISVGSINASIVRPAEIIREAIIKNAASMILVHNHPSGDPTPSREDIATTRRLVEAGELMDIPVVDHIILGEKSFRSLKQDGVI